VPCLFLRPHRATARPAPGRPAKELGSRLPAPHATRSKGRSQPTSEPAPGAPRPRAWKVTGTGIGRDRDRGSCARHGTAPVSGWPGGDADGRGDRGREVKESRKGDDGRADPSRARARRAPAFVAAVRCRACLPAGWTDWTPSILPSAFRTPSRPASEEDWVGASGCRRCFFPQESRARVVRLLVSSGR
jgi:hypothetical protein